MSQTISCCSGLSKPIGNEINARTLDCSTKADIITLLVGAILLSFAASKAGGSTGRVSFLSGGGAICTLSIGYFIYKAVQWARSQNLDLNTVSLSTFNKEDVDLAKQYLGRRRELWLECESGKKPKKLLAIHTVLMRETPQLKGFLWKVSLNGKTAYLYGTQHARMLSPQDTFDYHCKITASREDFDTKFDEWCQKACEKAQSILPSAVCKAISEAKKEIYVEATNDDKAKFERSRKSHNQDSAAALWENRRSHGYEINYHSFGSEWAIERIGSYTYNWANSLEKEDWAERLMARLAQALDHEPDYVAIKHEIAMQFYDACLTGNWKEFEEIQASQPESVQKALNGPDNTRNIHFVKETMRILSTSSSAAFIAIGASHFAGKEGILQLLIDEGAKIESIELNEESSNQN